MRKPTGKGLQTRVQLNHTDRDHLEAWLNVFDCIADQDQRLAVLISLIQLERGKIRDRAVRIIRSRLTEHQESVGRELIAAIDDQGDD